MTYLDPRSTGVGQVLTFAAAYGNGGDEDNVKAGTDYLGRLHAAGNVQRVEGTTPYAKFLKGEIPVWIGYENDGLKARHADGMGDACEIVIPSEASVAAPYAISLVKDGPNPNAGRLWLNFIMSDVGQRLFAQGFVRPSRRDVSPAGRGRRAHARRAADPPLGRGQGRGPQGRVGPVVGPGHPGQVGAP